MKNRVILLFVIVTVMLVTVFYFFGGEKNIIEGFAFDNTYIGDYDSNRPAKFTSFVLNVYKAGDSPVEDFTVGNSFRIVAIDENGSICDQKYFDFKFVDQAQPNCSCTTEPCVCPYPVYGGFKIILKCRTEAKKWQLYSGDKLLSETSTLEERN